MYLTLRIFAYLILLLCLFFNGLAVFATEQEGQSLQAIIETGGAYMGEEVCKSCHPTQHDQITQESHGQASDARTPFAANSCESCHGPGEKHVGIIKGGLVAFAGENPSPIETQNNMCVQCHQGGSMTQWHSSLHETENIACSACHSMHKPDLSMDRTTEAEVCYTCHNDIRALTYQRSTHPIRVAKVICSDCHASHGSNGPFALKQLTLNENCYDCHAEKRGPYLWEHNPVTEDCSLCHRTHGSNHPFLLTVQGPQLCQQCHAQIAPDGTGHVRAFSDYYDKDPKRGRVTLGRNCANCHKVHGSNHPSGVNLLR